MTNENYWRDRMIKLEARVKELEELIKLMETDLSLVKSQATLGERAYWLQQPIG